MAHQYRVDSLVMALNRIAEKHAGEARKVREFIEQIKAEYAKDPNSLSGPHSSLGSNVASVVGGSFSDETFAITQAYTLAQDYSQVEETS